MTEFSVRFWGVRGSHATSGHDFAEVGGNTSCVELRVGDEIIILDAGTGLSHLGHSLSAPLHATFFITHFHWDHIQGFPFFRPAYMPGNTFTLYGPGQHADGLEAALQRQMQSPHFPVTMDAMHAHFDFRSIQPGDEVRVGAARVRAASLNHPQGCLGYRISAGALTVVYATDTEHLAPGIADPGTLGLAQGADVLIYDAQYTDDEYHGHGGPPRQGWGHSTVSEACRLAHAAGVKQLVLFHHDPTHDDRAVARIIAEARSLFPNTIAACEGMRLTLSQPRALEARAA